jgi:NADH-quinone oxidoreductase subunit H
MESLAFYIFAAITILASIGVVGQRNPMYSVMLLITSFGALAGLYVLLGAPFDFPEAEQELVAGYHTEYSSMSFALFFMAEYINMVTVSAVATSLYLGGWLGPFLPEWLGWIWFMIKVLLILFFYVWMRWTLPRLRYDQLMEFGWKWLLPAAVLNLIATAALVIWLD